jgi:hypothetical protein
MATFMASHVMKAAMLTRVDAYGCRSSSAAPVPWSTG